LIAAIKSSGDDFDSIALETAAVNSSTDIAFSGPLDVDFGGATLSFKMSGLSFLAVAFAFSSLLTSSTDG
jgi:hypothetical protein